jgi:hypothetical protein
MTLGLKCIFCAQPAKRRMWVEVFGFLAVIYFCELHREIITSRGFRLEYIVGDQN